MTNQQRFIFVGAWVGWRLKQPHKDPAISQARLAEFLDLSFQQVQKV